MSDYKNYFISKWFGVGKKKNSGLFAFGILGIWDDDFREIDFTFWKYDVWFCFKGNPHSKKAQEGENE